MKKIPCAYSELAKPVADLRGARGTPPRFQILSISCSFWENLSKSYNCMLAPPGELTPPPRGNPGSATVNIELTPQDHRNSWSAIAISNYNIVSMKSIRPLFTSARSRQLLWT